jgi:hypothetical protein
MPGQPPSIRFFHLPVLFGILMTGCGIFEPRTPEDPTQSGLDFRPPTTPEIVIQNLTSAVDQKNAANYIACFADPTKTGRTFVFIAAPEASAQYPGVFTQWSLSDENDYFQNLVAKTSPTSYSNLLLTQKGPVIQTSDSMVVSYDYEIRFDHSDASFPKVATGNLQFTIGVDKNNFWSVYRWYDFKTTGDVTWSTMKGKFSN